MTKCLKIGISGLGVGVDHALRMEKLNDGIITGMFDPDPSKFEQAVCRSKNRDQIIRFDSFEHMAFSPEVEVIVIASPNYVHAAQMEICAAAGKPVFLEKPIGATIAQAQSICASVKQSGIFCQVGLVYRYSPFFRKVMELLHSGLIGEIQLMYCHEFVDWVWQPDWRNSNELSGGALVEKNCHHFDIFNWALRDCVEPLHVSAFGGRNFYRDREIIDNASVNVEYANGVRANLMLCLFSKYTGLEFGFIGSKGKLICHMDGCEKPRQDSIIFYPKDHMCKDRTVYLVDYDMEFDACKINPEAIHATNWGHSGNVVEVKEFVECVREGRLPFCTVEIGLAAMRIPAAAELSIRENRVVTFTGTDHEAL